MDGLNLGGSHIVYVDQEQLDAGGDGSSLAREPTSAPQDSHAEPGLDGQEPRGDALPIDASLAPVPDGTPGGQETARVPIGFLHGADENRPPFLLLVAPSSDHSLQDRADAADLLDGFVRDVRDGGHVLTSRILGSAMVRGVLGRSSGNFPRRASLANDIKGLRRESPRGTGARNEKPGGPRTMVEKLPMIVVGLQLRVGGSFVIADESPRAAAGRRAARS